MVIVVMIGVRFIVVRLECPFLNLVLTFVGLGGRLDVYEGNSSTYSVAQHGTVD